ncbi:SMAD/FHA domain-containing protein [Terfezia claveryi]|nr:SMAD/FHA domain-containing protein [Terfezia claveryi]
MSSPWDTCPPPRRDPGRGGRDHEGSKRESRKDRERDIDRRDRGRDWDPKDRKKEGVWERDREWDRERDRPRSGRDSGKLRDDVKRRSRDRSQERNRDRDREPRRSKGREGEDRTRESDRYKGRDREIEREQSPKAEYRGGGYRNRSPLPYQQVSFKGQSGRSRPGDVIPQKADPPKEKEKANFDNTGLLAAASNTLNSVVLKYTEPVDSRMPPAHTRWRLFTFKDGEIVGTPLDLNTQPTWLFGRDRLVADIPVDHPSCSKQHAVIQFRNVVKKNEFGDKEGGVRPYVVDLESANGTFLNKVKLEERRFMEMRERDMLVFGESTREYILMMEKD